MPFHDTSLCIRRSAFGRKYVKCGHIIVQMQRWIEGSQMNLHQQGGKDDEILGSYRQSRKLSPFFKIMIRFQKIANAVIYLPLSISCCVCRIMKYLNQ